jgi:SAM-dependent methyltransferase
MSASSTQLWDTNRVAETITSYWHSTVHEDMHRGALADLVQHCLPPARATVLEVGCGSGLVREHLVRAPFLRARYVGIDSSLKMLALATSNAPHSMFLAADGYHLPFRDRAFDLTLCFEVLGHLSDVSQLLTELIRVTRQTLLFTIWPNEAGDILETHEEVDGVIFPHRAYSDAYIRRQLADQRPDLVERTELYVFSAESWAYAVHLGDQCEPSSSVLPFRSYSQRQARHLQSMRTDIEERTRKIGELQDGLARSEQRVARLEEELAQGQRAAVLLLERLGDAEGVLGSERAIAKSVSDELACTRQRLAQANAGLARTRQLLGAAQKNSAIAHRNLEQTTRDLAQALEAAQGIQSRAQAAEEVARRALARAAAAEEVARGALARANVAEEAARREQERATAGEEDARGARARAETAEGRLATALGDEARQLSSWRHAARVASLELSTLRRRRLLRALSRLRPGPDLSPQVNPAFQDFLDDGRLFLDQVHRYRLHASEDIHASRALSYTLQLGRSNLSGLLLAPILDFPDDNGALEIELTASNGLALGRAHVDLADIEPHRPVRFTLLPIAASDAPMTLRVTVRDTVTPVRLFEWRRYPPWGLGAVATQPFCAFVFA